MKKGLFVGLLFVASALVVGCGKDNDNKQDTATMPANCLNNGGQGCQWSNMPNGFQNYPTNNGYYSQYSPYSGYQSYNSCPQGTFPIYDQYNGLACAPIQNPYQNYYVAPWGQGGYLMSCNPSIPNACGGGRWCEPLSQNPYANQWSWQRGYGSFGICRP